jgi:protein-tyrosine sulfotransferase
MEMHRRSASVGDAVRGTPELLVLVGAARSGTTLLRLILDAHPEIGCPPEAGIPSLIQHLGGVWWTIDAELRGDGGGDPLTTENAGGDHHGCNPDDDGARGLQSARLPELAADAQAAIREAALAPMRHYCEREGKRIYCDKSLDSVHHLAAVRHIFPETRYVMLFRHVMDTVASGIEASPWGFQAYGYLPFVERSPDNFVMALVNYWLTHVEKALDWEKAHPQYCLRVRYEDLVTAPEETVTRIFDFLDIVPDLTVLQTAFDRAARSAGPGDYKVIYTSTVESNSVGHGKRVPIGMIPEPQLEAINARLGHLGYEPLTKAWNAEPAPRSHGADPWFERLVELMRCVNPPATVDGDCSLNSLAVVAEDNQNLRWVIEPQAGAIRQGDGEVEIVVTGSAKDLVMMLGGEVNPGVLLRSGRIRYLTAGDDMSPEYLASVTRLVQSLNAGSTRVNGARKATRT